MAAKYPHGNKIYDLIIDIVMGLNQRQAEELYNYLLPKYTRRAKVKLYNKLGEEDPNGKVRLLPSQYKAIRVKFGDNYVHKAFTELTSYIEYLEAHVNDDSTIKVKLKKYLSSTHNIVLTEGWVYNKCKYAIVNERPKININPFLIDDIDTAREYISQIPESMRKTAMDVQSLLLKFPELVDE